jgi:DNA-binding GntR family transcriptional regulator
MTRAVALAAIERTTLNDLAYDRLKRAILSGHIEQGMTLTLRQLAADLGTSMMPVREAVTRLSAEQALMVIPNRGICIPPLGAAEATDLWNLRINLEGEATAQAARRASPDECAAIGRLAKELNKTILKHDLHAMLECNSDYQFAIYQAAGSPISLRIIETLRMRSLPYCTAALRHMLAEKPPYFERTLGYHLAIAAAIATRDPRAARRAKRTDLKELRALVESTGAHND